MQSTQQNAMQRFTEPLQVVPSGHVLQQAALAIYADLEKLTRALGTMTADLRYSRLQGYISRTRRKLSALLAVLTWCDNANTTSYVAAVNGILYSNSNVHLRYNEALDSAYFLHQGLYSRKVRSLPVLYARDIMAKGTYSLLPATILERGVQPTALPLEDEIADPALELAIQVNSMHMSFEIGRASCRERVL